MTQIFDADLRVASHAVWYKNIWRPTLCGIRIYGSALNALPFIITNSNDEFDS